MTTLLNPVQLANADEPMLVTFSCVQPFHTVEGIVTAPLTVVLSVGLMSVAFEPLTLYVQDIPLASVHVSASICRHVQNRSTEEKIIFKVVGEGGINETIRIKGSRSRYPFVSKTNGFYSLYFLSSLFLFYTLACCAIC